MAAPIALASVRVPCPLCAKPIHPIAGHCRHCGGDVVGKVSAKPAPAPRARRPRIGFVAALVVVAIAAIGAQLAHLTA